MINNFSYKQLLFAGIFFEAIIFFIFFFSKQDLAEVFRYSARYSGRLSLIIYLYCFYKFYKAFLNNDKLKNVKDLVFIFGVLHVIHFGFLALSVYLNDLPIIPVKITGGALAYFMIIIYPFIIEKIKKHIYHLIYFLLCWYCNAHDLCCKNKRGICWGRTRNFSQNSLCFFDSSFFKIWLYILQTKKKFYK
jgi:hypothetical protein